MTSENFKKWNLILGWGTFAIALITYSLTLEPTVSAWDCGEYISTSVKLEVGHPPGAPLFQMLGAFFAMFTSELTWNYFKECLTGNGLAWNNGIRSLP